MNRTLLVAVSLLTALAAVPAAAAAPPPGVHLEVDPATFVLGGGSLHVRADLGRSGWAVGAGAYAMDLPSPIVDLAPANRGEGWDVRIAAGGALFVDRLLRGAEEGPLAGVELGVQRVRLRKGGAAAEAAYTAALVMPRAGWLWRPLGGRLYLLPWGGVGAAFKVGGETRVGGATYAPPRLSAFATLHLGWTI